MTWSLCCYALGIVGRVIENVSLGNFMNTVTVRIEDLYSISNHLSHLLTDYHSQCLSIGVTSGKES